MITTERLDYLRRKEAHDRWTLRRLWTGVAVILVIVSLLILLDLGFRPIVGTEAVVAAKVDNWTLKRGERCLTSLDTPLGRTSISDLGRCAQRPWSVGDHVKIAAKIGRITGSIALMRDFGVFAVPRMNTAGGLDVFPTRDYVTHPPEPVRAGQQPN